MGIKFGRNILSNLNILLSYSSKKETADFLPFLFLCRIDVFTKSIESAIIILRKQMQPFWLRKSIIDEEGNYI